MLNKIMERLNKPFEPITTLIIIYFALVAISIALYALIQIFFKSDTATATGLLGWTATIFATIALLYTFNSWRDQKGSDVLSSISKEIYMDLHKLQDLTTETIDSTFFQFLNYVVSSDPMKNYNNKYQYKNDELEEAYKRICGNLEIIKKYKSKDSELNIKINLFKSHHTSIHSLIKEMDTVIGTTEMVKEYDKEKVENIKKTIYEKLKNYKYFIKLELNRKLIDYIFCIK